jgi:hypothetical protein
MRLRERTRFIGANTGTAANPSEQDVVDAEGGFPQHCDNRVASRSRNIAIAIANQLT